MAFTINIYYTGSNGSAKRFANTIKGDLFKIKPIEKYSEEDLDLTNKQSRSCDICSK